MKFMDLICVRLNFTVISLQSPRIREGEPLSTKAVPTSPLVCQTDYSKKITFLEVCLFSHSRRPSEFCGSVWFLFLYLMILILIKVVTILLGFLFDNFTPFSAFWKNRIIGLFFSKCTAFKDQIVRDLLI